MCLIPLSEIADNRLGFALQTGTGPILVIQEMGEGKPINCRYWIYFSFDIYYYFVCMFVYRHVCVCVSVNIHSVSVEGRGKPWSGFRCLLPFYLRQGLSMAWNSPPRPD